MFKIYLILFITIELFASPVVMISKKNIKWRDVVKRSDVYLVEVTEHKYECNAYVNIDELITSSYRAKHYISKNRKICKKDLYKAKEHKVVFNFGLLEIQRDGELVNETDQYIKLRNSNGQIEKIYKSGNNQ